MAGPEARATDQAGEGRDGEPGSGVASLALESGELLFGDVFQIAGQLRGKAEVMARFISVRIGARPRRS
jgi:hypothetical protein